jgi:hypothetical protein
MEGTVKLKKPKTSSKFGVVFPSNTELKCFVDGDMRLFVEHPTHENVHILVNYHEQYDFKTTNEKI